MIGVSGSRILLKYLQLKFIDKNENEIDGSIRSSCDCCTIF